MKTSEETMGTSPDIRPEPWNEQMYKKKTCTEREDKKKIQANSRPVRKCGTRQKAG
jgi:hypothetical protein